jgi:hypothetical protein
MSKKDFIGYICGTLNTSIIALAIDSDSFYLIQIKESRESN